MQTIGIVDFGSSKTPFIHQTVQMCGQQTAALLPEKIAETPLASLDGVILSGAPILLTRKSPAPFLAMLQPVWTSGKPVLGICFGHQLMGLHFGATIFRGPAVRKQEMIRLYHREHPLLAGLERTENMAEDHTEGITLPGNFMLLGSSIAYGVEIMAHQSLPYFGVQFHPEVSALPGRQLMRNFIHICHSFQTSPPLSTP